MSLPGLNSVERLSAEPIRAEQLVFEQRLQRVMRFASVTIDEVLNCPVARWKVSHYYKVGLQIDRQFEIDDLEAQWNPLGRRTD